jgi:hypothetical protein
MTSDKQILAVPTNIITGFLGVGKTSAILHLLKQKPSDERWAVLVNEFGEIGVDGSIISGQSPQKKKEYLFKKYPVVVCVVLQVFPCRWHLINY